MTTTPMRRGRSRIPAGAPAARPIAALYPGLLLAVTVAGVATTVGRAAPLVGGPVAGVVLGVALSACVRRQPRLTAGLALVAGRVLQLAVALLGAQVSLRQVARIGVDSLPVMPGTLVVCLGLAELIGRRLGVARDLRTLIGVGTGICGASAIATVSPVIRARAGDVAYAVSTIFLFNIAAVLTFPAIGHALGLSEHAFGLFAGTAVNDTSSVVAAATSYGTAASNYAVVVKLTRTLMIIPISVVLGALVQRRIARTASPETVGSGRAVRSMARLVPWFLVGFLGLAAVNSAAPVPAALRADLAAVTVFLVTAALAAIGMTTDTAAICRAGARPIVLGGLLWVAVATTSLSLQALTTRL